MTLVENKTKEKSAKDQEESVEPAQVLKAMQQASKTEKAI